MEYQNEYTELIAGAHFDKPKFKRWIFELTEPFRIARERLSKFPTEYFDVDKAVGKQLDAIGVRVGISRKVDKVLTDVFFALDNQDGVGFDLGVWRLPNSQGTTLVDLDDETYRAVIKSKIDANTWDGTLGELDALLKRAVSYFGEGLTPPRVYDTGDMSIPIVLSIDSNAPVVLLQLLRNGVIPIITAGVGYAVVDENPIFGFDFDTTSVKGFDQGQFVPFNLH